MKKVLIIIFFSCLIIGRLTAQGTEEQIDDILRRLSKGENVENIKVNLRDVNFEFNSADLDPSTTVYLDKVVAFLKQLNTIDLLITGHTDNVGQESVNLDLSLKRAESVRAYLIKNGIEDNRIQSEGKGASSPIETNETADGRKKNRRVEFTIIRKETAKSIQDLIYFRNGEILGVIIRNIASDSVYYISFEDGKEYSIHTDQLTKVRYSNGEEIFFKQQIEIPTVRKSFNLVDWISENLPFLTEPEIFGKHSSTWQLTYGISSNLGDLPFYDQIVVPPLALLVERGVTSNIGVGIAAGVHMWKQPVLDYNYGYYYLGLRGAYHFRIHPKLDPYVGAEGNYRYVRLNSGEISVNENGFYADALVGVRYYLLPRLGLVAEIGTHDIATYHVGLHFLVSRK